MADLNYWLWLPSRKRMDAGKILAVLDYFVTPARAYYAAGDGEPAARAETESFLGKVYGGSLGLLVSAMVESRALTEEDLAELSAILEKGGEKP